jgi:uncharacterized membrane-anchored protein
MKRLHWFVTIVAAQVLLLLGWAGYHEWNRQTARTILLLTEPVDPRDLLRGDFMILGYKISRVPAPVGTTGPVAAGRELWVSLRANGRFHEVTTTSWARPVDPDPTVVVVRGRTHGRSDTRTLRVDYGIEKYFVPEGQGRPIFKEMVVEATVGPLGDLGIKRLLLDGEPYP